MARNYQQSTDEYNPLTMVRTPPRCVGCDNDVARSGDACADCAWFAHDNGAYGNVWSD